MTHNEHKPTLGRQMLNLFLGTFVKTATVLIVVVLIFVFISSMSNKEQEAFDAKFFAIDWEYKYLGGDSYAEDYILFVPIRGMIMGNQPNGISFEMVFSQDSVTYASKISNILEDAAADDDIQGIVLQIDSPGGTVFGAKMIQDAIDKYKKETSKPVYAHIVGMGTSAAYRVASSCDKVYAEEGSQIGSVGVIAGPFKKYDEVVGESTNSAMGSTSISAYGDDKYQMKGGIHTYFITAGKYKDMGNPYRRMTKEEKLNIQRDVDSIYKTFVSLVSTKRGIEEKELKEENGAFAFVASRAAIKKYIDGVANRDTVVANMQEAIKDTGSVMLIETVPVLPAISPIMKLFGYGANQTIQTTQLTPLMDMQNKICGNSINILAYHGNIQSLCR